MTCYLLAGLTIAVAITAWSQPAGRSDEAEPAIVPRPQKLSLTGGRCSISKDWKIIAEKGNPDAMNVATQLAAVINKSTVFDLKVLDSGDDSANVIIITSSGADPSLNDEGYTLQVTPDRITIAARSGAGLFYGSQTLLQLFNDRIFRQKQMRDIVDWSIPCCRIVDQPRFKWRGLMLDVSRHFLDKDEVKHFIDIMAMQKLNTFHWHLVDDQGWRIEIKKYPKLTELGAWRNGIGFGLKEGDSKHYRADGKYGGFYTQDEIRQVVAYAKSKYITVVPEIEMPGHSSAALTAYPQFSCEGKPFDPNVAGGVFHGVYCAGNEQTYEFLQDILSEVMELFPGTFIHIGGDEVPRDNWKKCEKCQALKSKQGLKDEDELQSYFIRRMDTFLDEKGRRLIGWDEILDGGLAPGATVMSWRGVKGGIAAANAGHDCVMSPGSHCYLDHAQATNGEPRNIGGFTSLERAYSYEPIPSEVAPDKQHHILGVQGNLWAEYFPNYAHVQYMAFPRGSALAEVGWTDQYSKSYPDFERRMQVHLNRFRNLGFNYRPIDPPGFADPFAGGDDGRVRAKKFFEGQEVCYTLDGTRPTDQSDLLESPIRIDGLKTLYVRWRDPARGENHFASATIVGSIPARISTDWGPQRDHPLQHAFDGDESTWFQTGQRVGKDQTLTLNLLEPRRFSSIRVVTGANAEAKNGIRDGGMIESSIDGRTWTTVAIFKDNVAEGALPEKPVTAIRLRVVDDQQTVLIVRDIHLK